MLDTNFLFGMQDDEERSDYRPVPSSDRGNAGYTDRGMLGDYCSSEQPFRTPSDVRFFTGFGGDSADLERGWSVPSITENPAYDLANYKERSSMPMQSDVTPGNREAMLTDLEFRNRNRRTRGFLTRPRIPTERG